MDSKILKKLSNYTLLFVENEKGIRENFEEFFKLLFKEVYVAVDGLDGLDKYKQNKPDLIITDIKMPNMDGIELVSKVREEDSEISIVIISAHTELELLLQSIPLRLIEYLVKPLNQTKLNEVFEKFINQKEIMPFTYDKEKSEIIIDSKSHSLSLKENLFLDKIINEKRIITYEEIELDIWDGKDMSQNALRLFIKNLRKKLPKDFIRNIPSQGYISNQ